MGRDLRDEIVAPHFIHLADHEIGRHITNLVCFHVLLMESAGN